MKRIAKALFVCATFGAMVAGVSNLTAPRAEAIPIFLCGPSYLWICSGPGGPDILFGGTICDRARFERRTGLTCVPYTG